MTSTTRVEFCDKFQREADDTTVTPRRNDEEMNTGLIFVSVFLSTSTADVVPISPGEQVGLFSAVTPSFIVDVHNKLEPYFQEMS